MNNWKWLLFVPVLSPSVIPHLSQTQNPVHLRNFTFSSICVEIEGHFGDPRCNKSDNSPRTCFCFFSFFVSYFLYLIFLYAQFPLSFLSPSRFLSRFTRPRPLCVRVLPFSYYWCTIDFLAMSSFLFLFLHLISPDQILSALSVSFSPFSKYFWSFFSLYAHYLFHEK